MIHRKAEVFLRGPIRVSDTLCIARVKYLFAFPFTDDAYISTFVKDIHAACPSVGHRETTTKYALSLSSYLETEQM